MLKKNANLVAIPIIVINGVILLLMTFFDKGRSGLYTFKNLFFISVILTMLTFAFGGLKESFSIIRDRFKKKAYLAVAIQSLIAIFVVYVVGSVVWLCVTAIVKSIQ